MKVGEMFTYRGPRIPGAYSGYGATPVHFCEPGTDVFITHILVPKVRGRGTFLNARFFSYTYGAWSRISIDTKDAKKVLKRREG